MKNKLAKKLICEQADGASVRLGLVVAYMDNPELLEQYLSFLDAFQNASCDFLGQERMSD